MKFVVNGEVVEASSGGGGLTLEEADRRYVQLDDTVPIRGDVYLTDGNLSFGGEAAEDEEISAEKSSGMSFDDSAEEDAALDVPEEDDEAAAQESTESLKLCHEDNSLVRLSVGAPTTPDDCATKRYVDHKVLEAGCGAITETETELSIAKRVASGVQVVLTVDTNNASQNTCSFHFTNEYDETEVVTLRPPSSTAQNTDLVTKAYVDGLLTSKGEDGVPSGVIVMWSGAKNAIPSGWALCDGTKGTPDLRDRFVLGAGGRYSVGAKGGEETHTLTVNEMPGHTHDFLVDAEPREGRGSVLMYVEENDTVSTRSGALKSAGGSQSHNNMPPYYALSYIMKL